MEFEAFPPNMLLRNGWKRDKTLKPGMKVTIFGWRRAMDRTSRTHARSRLKMGM